MSVSPEQVPLRTAKSWAKRLHHSLAPTPYAAPLAQCQKSVSTMLGYDDWHALTKRLTPQDNDLGTSSSSAAEDLSFTALSKRSSSEAWCLLLREASRQGMDDIHLEMREQVASVRGRVFGQLSPLAQWPQPFANGLFRGLLDLAPWASSLFDESNNAFAQGLVGAQGILEKGKVAWYLRIQMLPAYPSGRDAVIRLNKLASADLAPSLSALGFSSDQSALMDSPLLVDGLLVAANTGKGQTSTLRALCQIKMGDYSSPQVIWDNQGDWPGDSVFPYTSLIRPRFDSDASGERADAEDVLTAGQVALARGGTWVQSELRSLRDGALLRKAAKQSVHVLAGLHASGALGILDRLEDFGLDKHTIAHLFPRTTLVYQNLLPTLCPHCAAPLRANQLSPESWSRWSSYIGPRSHLLVRGPGCAACRQGYSGRTVAAEVVTMTDDLWETWKSGNLAALAKQWHALSDHDPWSSNLTGKSALEHALLKALQGQISPIDVEERMGRVCADSLPG